MYKRQGYRQPVSHDDYEFITHRFRENNLIEYIKECICKVNGDISENDEKIIEDFVKNKKS